MYSLPGSYRKIVVKPWNFSYRFTTYNDANQDLILSEVETLRGFELRPGELKVRIRFLCASPKVASSMT